MVGSRAAALGSASRRPEARPRAVALLLAALLVALVGAAPVEARVGPPAHVTRPAAHELWIADQGTDLIHVHDGTTHAEVATIDVSPAALRAQGFPSAPSGPATVPHMIDFDSGDRYAFVAATAGGVTLVIDASGREVVAVLPTGPVSHMAAVTPDDSAVWVAAIGTAAPGTQALVEIPLDLDAAVPTFAIGRRVVVRDVLEPYAAARGWEFPGYQPVCHQYTPDSREAWITLGPAWDRGGLFVLDLETATVSAAFDPAEVKANCGVGVNAQGTRVVANWSGQVLGPDGDTEGEWYLINARTKRLLRTESARGLDAHGMRFTPDGRQIWAFNRLSDDGIVLDGHSFRMQRMLPAVADTPDIPTFSPDSRLAYVSQRGPVPRSGGVHAAAGQQPGVRVLDTTTAQTVALIQHPVVRDTAGAVLNDVHGIEVRALPDGVRPPRSPKALLRRPAVVPADAAALAVFSCDLRAG